MTEGESPTVSVQFFNREWILSIFEKAPDPPYGYEGRQGDYRLSILANEAGRWCAGFMPEGNGPAWTHYTSQESESIQEAAAALEKRLLRDFDVLTVIVGEQVC